MTEPQKPTYVYVVMESDKDDDSGEFAHFPTRVFPTQEAAQAWITEQETTRWPQRLERLREELDPGPDDDEDMEEHLSWEWHMVALGAP